ncbi:Cold-regulated 413 plasma membrane protein 4, partial [Mucuna pruriens]
MRTDFKEEAAQSINSDLRDLNEAANKLAQHVIMLGISGSGVSLLQFIASIAAMAEFGKWVALIAVVLRLFLPRHFPDWLELPAALILLIVVAPDLLANTCRSNAVGVAICLIIACYLLQEHIRASGGFRDSFTKAHGLSNTIGIIILLVFPIWTLCQYFWLPSTLDLTPSDQ